MTIATGQKSQLRVFTTPRQVLFLDAIAKDSDWQLLLHGNIHGGNSQYALRHDEGSSKNPDISL
jgi:hypothetical protein